jgi:hypothetical protein
MIDSRVREFHISKYGETEDVLDYLRVLESLTPVPDNEPGENHHMLAKSAFPEFADLNANPWNRLRVRRGLHIGLTKIQGWFDARLRHAALMMQGMTAEAFLETAKRNGTIQGKIAVESGQLAEARQAINPERRKERSKILGKRVHELYPDLARQNGLRNVANGHMAKIQPIGCRLGGIARGNHPENLEQVRNMATPESRAAGGRIAGKINGRKNVESGHLARIRPSPERSRELLSRYRTPEHQARAGRKGAHVNQHVNRGIVNPACVLCATQNSATAA